MTQTAIVTRIIDEKSAEVTVERGTACGGNCGSCGGTCSYKNMIKAVAANSICARVGDKVTIQSHTSRVIGAAALLYLTPIVTFLLGYMLSALAGTSETVSIAISMLCLFLGLFAVVIINRRKQGQSISFEIINVE